MIDPDAIYRFQRFSRRLGVVIVVLSLFLFLSHQARKARYIKTEGIVTNVEQFSVDDLGEEKVYFQITVAYSMDGTDYEVKREDGTAVNGKSPYEIDEKIIIYVNPENPESYFVKNDNISVFLTIFGLLFGSVLFITGWLGSKRINVDTEGEYESSRKAHWTIKYGFYIVGIYLILKGWKSGIVDLGIVTLEGYEQLNQIQQAIFIIVGGLCVVFGFILRKSFAILKFSNEGISIRKYGKPSLKKKGGEININWPLKNEVAIDWSEVKNIRMLHFVYPPTYVLVRKHRFHLFSTKSEKEGGRTILDYVRFKKVKDPSTLGQFLAKKREELAELE